MQLVLFEKIVLDKTYPMQCLMIDQNNERKAGRKKGVKKEERCYNSTETCRAALPSSGFILNIVFYVLQQPNLSCTTSTLWLTS